jgi:hypothetical protein
LELLFRNFASEFNPNAGFMRRKTSNEYTASHLFIGLLLGFVLGSGVVYWHSNRQTDRVIDEVMEKVAALFSSGNIMDNSRQNAGNKITETINYKPLIVICCRLPLTSCCSPKF